jgi:hypothetical protein
VEALEEGLEEASPVAERIAGLSEQGHYDTQSLAQGDTLCEQLRMLEPVKQSSLQSLQSQHTKHPIQSFNLKKGFSIHNKYANVGSCC